MQIWFTAGVVFGGIAMVFSVYVLVTMLFKNMTEDKPEQMLTPIVCLKCFSFLMLSYFKVE